MELQNSSYIVPVITKKNCKNYKHDEFYKEYLETINQCKKLSVDDQELQFLSSYAEKTIELVFFAKHNHCEIIYDKEDMLDRAFIPLLTYVGTRYNRQIKTRFFYF